jgi:hypothetical protein
MNFSTGSISDLAEKALLRCDTSRLDCGRAFRITIVAALLADRLQRRQTPFEPRRPATVGVRKPAPAKGPN